MRLIGDVHGAARHDRRRRDLATSAIFPGWRRALATRRWVTSGARRAAPVHGLARLWHWKDLRGVRLAAAPNYPARLITAAEHSQGRQLACAIEYAAACPSGRNDILADCRTSAAIATPFCCCRRQGTWPPQALLECHQAARLLTIGSEHENRLIETSASRSSIGHGRPGQQVGGTIGVAVLDTMFSACPGVGTGRRPSRRRSAGARAACGHRGRDGARVRLTAQRDQCFIEARRQSSAGLGR
jgi:hypothetical protein